MSLAAVLATKDVVAGRMGGTVLGALARALTDSDDAASATEALTAVVNDVDLAANTVVHEVATASATAADDSYDEQGIDLVDILNGPNPCPTCLDSPRPATRTSRASSRCTRTASARRYRTARTGWPGRPPPASPESEGGSADVP